jgi:hypothetical protein
MGFAALYPSYELLRARCGRMGRAQRNPSSRRDSTLPEAALSNDHRSLSLLLVPVRIRSFLPTNSHTPFKGYWRRRRVHQPLFLMIPRMGWPVALCKRWPTAPAFGG